MNSFLLSPPAESQKTLLGFLRSKVAGRSGTIKRLIVETSNGCEEVRLPKELREIAELELEIGAAVRIWVRSEGKKRTAVCLVPLQPRQVIQHGCPTVRTCIQVCNSKNCCRRGGDEVFSKLREAAQATPGLEVKKCGCLKECRKGPIVRIPGLGVKPLKLAEVPRLVERLAPRPAWN